MSIQTFIYKYACNNGQYVLGVKLYNRLSYTVIVFEEINNDEKNETEMYMYSNDTRTVACFVHEIIPFLDEYYYITMIIVK